MTARESLQRVDAAGRGLLSAVDALREHVHEGAGGVAAAAEALGGLNSLTTDALALLALIERLASSGASLEDAAGSHSQLSAHPELLLAMAVVSEDAVDDLLILPRDLREARLEELAEGIGVDKQTLRGFSIRWHSVYKKLLTPGNE